MKKLQNTFLCLSLNAKLVLCVKYSILVVLHYDSSRMFPLPVRSLLLLFVMLAFSNKLAPPP
jgi:hypothetical protein